MAIRICAYSATRRRPIITSWRGSSCCWTISMSKARYPPTVISGLWALTPPISSRKYGRCPIAAGRSKARSRTSICILPRAISIRLLVRPAVICGTAAPRPASAIAVTANGCRKARMPANRPRRASRRWRATSIRCSAVGISTISIRNAPTASSMSCTVSSATAVFPV